jgi:hypothetical protein
LHVGNPAPPVQTTGGHAQISSDDESGTVTHGWPPGQARKEHAGASPSTQTSLSDGTQPHVPRPPGTQASPGGHAPSHSNVPTGPHGSLPAMHWHSPPTFLQIGADDGHSPRHAPATRCPHRTVGAGQLPPHASQQLAHAPIVPPRSVQLAASGRTLQRDTPFRTVQHVTAPGRPQVERDAQRETSRAHCGDRIPRAPRVRTTPRAHVTYERCVPAPAQSQSVSTCARAAATAAASPGSSPHRASAGGAADSTSDIAIATRRTRRDILER